MPAPILIAGGGIGGLTAALSLARAGFEVRLYERAPAFSEVGAGLQLSPNASRLLIALGLRDALAPVVGVPEALIVRSAGDATKLAEMPLGLTAERRWGAPYWVAHRADLLDSLVAAVRAEPRFSVTLGVTVEGVDVTPTGVTLRLSGAEGRRDDSGSLLVAADGVRSRLRGALLRDGPPRFTSRAAFRATLPIAAAPPLFRANVTGLWIGARAHLVHYPLRGGRLVNVVAIVSDDRPDGDWALGATREEIRARFATWAEPARALVARPDDWTRWALFDRPPDTTWPRGRVALLGDAAHPMVPFLAQGAAMAIEDAAVLTRCLTAAGDDIPGAIARYNRSRLPRVGRVQGEASRNGTIFHLGGPLGAARDAALSLMGGAALARRYDWLYGFRV